MFGRVFRYQGWLWRALNTLTFVQHPCADAGRGDDGAL